MDILAFLIWLIFIVFFIMRKGKKGQEKIEKGTERKTQSRNIYWSRESSSAGANTPGKMNDNRISSQKNFAVMPEQKKVPPNVERKCAVEDGHRSENNLRGKNPVPTAVPNVTRAYTEPSPKVEKKKRMVAMRLYEGDHVPQGYRMVKCRYCAAENLIAHSSRGEYKCYFCHTEL